MDVGSLSLTRNRKVLIMTEKNLFVGCASIIIVVVLLALATGIPFVVVWAMWTYVDMIALNFFTTVVMSMWALLNIVWVIVWLSEIIE